MATVAERKERQEYERKPVWPTCSNCEHFSMRTERLSRHGCEWVKEKDKRCGVGCFTTIKTATCVEHSLKTQE